MRKVVLFKSESEEYRRACSERAFEAVFVEPLRVELRGGAGLAGALGGAGLAGLCVTSPRAVDALAACWDPAKFVCWSARRVYAVGDATARRVKQSLGLDARGAEAGNVHNLAKIIIEENPAPATFLFPCGNLGAEVLPALLEAAGLHVRSLPVYETRESERLRSDLLELNELAELPCCLVFFSPSGCEYIHRQLQTFNNRLFHLPHFAIGNSTAHKIETLGIEIAGVAAKPKPESIMDSVQKYFESQSCS